MALPAEPERSALADLEFRPVRFRPVANRERPPHGPGRPHALSSRRHHMDADWRSPQGHWRRTMRYQPGWHPLVRRHVEGGMRIRFATSFGDASEALAS